MEWNPYFKGRNGNLQYFFVYIFHVTGTKIHGYGAEVSVKLAKIIVPL
jgi:hypothetical protein